MPAGHFFRLNETPRDLMTELSTANDPIKRMLLCDGEHLSANDELVIILEGECGFRVGDGRQGALRGPEVRPDPLLDLRRLVLP